MIAKKKAFKEPKIFENIIDSLVWLTEQKDAELLDKIYLNNKIDDASSLNFNHCDDSQNEEKHINVFITGSLYLVGLALEVLNFKI